MSNLMAEKADSQHPWVGLASFTESDREFFAGRGNEIEDLIRLVERDTLTLLYGISGLGKTSLLQAGVFPTLREDNYLPVPIRLDYLEGAASLANQVLDAIIAAAIAAEVEAPKPRPGDTLWEYFHREGNHFWSRRNDVVTPFLAFDQFEEFFTLGRDTPARVAQGTAFISELADLIENRPSPALRDDPSRAKEFNFNPVPVKVLLSMREDYLAELDRIRSHFRALGQNRLRLLPMGEEQARQVIDLGAPLLASGVEDRIVKYIAGPVDGSNGADLTIAPALLSLVLRELNERRLARGSEAKITPDLLDIEQHKIFDDFYLRTLQEFPESVRIFIEDQLLTATGHRSSCALDDALTRPDVNLPVLNELVNRRLLAYEDRHNSRRVELTHDVLVPVIKASRDNRLTREALAQAERLQAEQIAQKRKQQITAAVAGVLAVALIATICGGYYFFLQEHRAYYREFAKMNGFPVGIGRISKGEASKLRSSILLISKGIQWKGWKPAWKPAFRMVAVDGHLQPTTNHSIRTYLWRGEFESGDTQQGQAERLGLENICQWEFVSNANGEIMYERGLDRDNRMVSALIYSPLESGRSNTRLARFVGPDGFPQLQRDSAAEYVSLEYDAHGWETRIMYRDGKNHPAIGPDGAFGQRREYNNLGQPTIYLSLDADGHNMIDEAGNCGMQLSYNKQGWLVEERSVGPDLKPMQVNGFVVERFEYDNFGRAHRVSYYGLRDEPVLEQKVGCHDWEWQYDEHGNQTATTFFGLDGKPMLLPDGYAEIKSEYDGHGKRTRSSYYGANGEPVLHKEGNHGWEARYDERGNQIAVTYFGLDGKPVLLPAGFARIQSQYNVRGRRTRARYYGANEEPVLHKDGNHGWEAQYDEGGNQIALTFFGLDEKPVVTSYGYAIVQSKYDVDGHELERAYFDAAEKPKPTLDKELAIHKIVRTYDGRGKISGGDYYGVRGEPVLSNNGYHGWRPEYDERGNNTVTTFLGMDEKPMFLPEGYAIVRAAYDARGKKIRTSYYGIKDESVLYKDGYATVTNKYNERGDEIEVTYFGVDGKLVLIQGGLARWTRKYDEQGNEVERAFFGIDNKPVLIKDGYASTTSKWDERGRITEVAYFGVDGKPVLIQGGYAGVTSKWDERGNKTEVAYFGVDSKPVLIKDGYASVTMKYDERGNKTEFAYFGVDGKLVLTREGLARATRKYDERGNEIERAFFDIHNQPVLMKDGYASVTGKYNDRGKTTEIAYFGADNRPVLIKDGYASVTFRYDERGNETEKAYFGTDGKSILLPDGYAIIRSEYDLRGMLTGVSYYGVNQEAVLRKDGYHSLEEQYDERGNKIEESFLGSDGKPILLPDGFAIVKWEYDGRGRQIRMTLYGVNGEPVSNIKGFHGWEKKYDEFGKVVDYFNIGLDGQRIRSAANKQKTSGN